MCGLNVILDKKSNLSPELILRMNRATHHRGPDNSGLYVHRSQEKTYFFGHNRLKIIDCSDAANQPFFSENERYLLLYNGEIYNYRDLRRDLKTAGYTFRTESDTEVVLTLLIHYGAAGLEKLNGMFALAFFDLHTNELVIARDRFGQKPLYYAQTDDFFLVSSEIKGIQASGLIKKELNESQLAHYLTYKHARKPATFFRNILELEEGKYGVFSEKGLEIRTFISTFPAKNATISEPAQIVARTEELLQSSLSRQLQSDVPLGLFLSGGIDSTLLLALLAQAGHANFPAFSVANQAAERSFGSDDFHFARLAAQQFGARHTVFEIDDSVFQGFLPLIDCLDQPIADGATLLTDFLAKKTRTQVKVALSGAGADELFGGYNRHRAFYAYLQNRSLLLLAKPFLQMIAPTLPTGIAHPWRKQFRLLKKMAVKLKHDPGKTFRLFTAMDAELRYCLKNQTKTFSAENPTVFKHKNDWLHWALEQDQHEYLISDILALTDQTSMRNSLEVRLPYLDNDLHAFTNSLRPDLIFQHGQKWILKALLRQQEGDAFISRPKEGFGMPLGLWLRKPNNQWLFEPLQNRKSVIFNYLDFDAVQQLRYKHQRGKHDYSVELWALITLAFWLEKHFGA
ncbi:asparagine synthase (glutamine-hydrolyzing) [Adhaeribacter terreus]|uniref:asparagine synthase (glutamine-hydrolyzing) n=1 Tax=Adhaeribacter terreus TaxID=529703 RepID=A0ABW0E872_9BACT